MAVTDLTQKLYSTTDAAVWAREFVSLFPDADEGLMIGWFANAIETGRRHGCQDQEAKLVEITELHRQPAAIVGLTTALVTFENTRRILGIQAKQ
jgi:hypothetical protein